LLGGKQAGGERRNGHGTAAGEGQTLWSRQGAAGVGCYGIRGAGGAPAVLEKATIVFDAPSSEEVTLEPQHFALGALKQVKQIHSGKTVLGGYKPCHCSELPDECGA
jgi:hypothetical protein